MRSRTTAIVVGCALAAVALAGCKSSTVSTAGSGPNLPATGQTTSAAPAESGSTAPSGGGSGAATSGGGSSTADGLGHPVNVCSLLPAATVAQLSGEPITTGKEVDLPNTKAYTCAYTDAVGTSNMAVTVLAKNAAGTYNTGVAAFGSEATPINGVGDKAYAAVNSVQALFGDVLISVTDITSSDAAVKIIKTLQPLL